MSVKQKFSLVVVIVYGVLLLVAAGLSGTETVGVNGGIVVLILIAIYTAASIKKIGPTDLGRIDFFGRPLFQVESGPIFVPFLFCTKERETKNAVQLVLFTQMTAEERGQKLDTEKTSVIHGKVEDLSIMTSPASSAQYDDSAEKLLLKDDVLHNTRLTLKPKSVVRLKIADFLRFTSEVGDLAEGLNQIEELVGKVLQAQLSRRTAAQILRNYDKLSTLLQMEVEKLTGEEPYEPELDQQGNFVFDPDTGKKEGLYKPSWGVDVLSVTLSETTLDALVEQSTNEATAAINKKRKTITEAEAEAASVREKGFAQADVDKRNARIAARAKQLLGVAEAMSLKALAKQMDKEPGILAAQLQAMREALSKGNNNLFMAGGSFADILSALTKTLTKNTGIIKP
ncbi:MAG: hypothetical protein RJA61_723 [Candidatus Parcubacteria bacterium]|jgi:regulator of protease activity HflC (stomatin/prohibitin superfamily)